MIVGRVLDAESCSISSIAKHFQWCSKVMTETIRVASMYLCIQFIKLYTFLWDPGHSTASAMQNLPDFACNRWMHRFRFQNPVHSPFAAATYQRFYPWLLCQKTTTSHESIPTLLLLMELNKQTCSTGLWPNSDWWASPRCDQPCAYSIRLPVVLDIGKCTLKKEESWFIRYPSIKRWSWLKISWHQDQIFKGISVLSFTRQQQ